MQESAPRRAGRPRGIYLTNSPALESFKRVLAWNLETNAKSIVGLTESLLPFLTSHIVVRGDRVTISDKTGLASLELLFKLNYIEIMGRDSFTDFGEVPKDVRVRVSEMKEIKQRFEDFVAAYAATKDASRALSDVSHKLTDYTTRFGMLIRKEDVTDLGELQKYEKVVREFVKRVQQTDWSLLRQSEYNRYLSAFQEGKVVMFDLSLDWRYTTATQKTFNRYPFIVHRDFKTDIERYVSPFFTYIESLDDRYTECVELFKELKDRSGFLKSPPDELKRAALEALYKFDAEYNGLSSGPNYCWLAHFRAKEIEDRYAKDILRRINDALNKPTSDGYIKNAEDIIRRIYRLLMDANSVEPVVRKITAR